VRLDRLYQLNLHLMAAQRWVARAQDCLAPSTAHHAAPYTAAAARLHPAPVPAAAGAGAAEAQRANGAAATSALAPMQVPQGDARAMDADGGSEWSREGSPPPGDDHAPSSASPGLGPLDEEEAALALLGALSQPLPAPAPRSASRNGGGSRKGGKKGGGGGAAAAAVTGAVVVAPAAAAAPKPPPQLDLVKALLKEYEESLLVRASEAEGLRRLRAGADAWLQSAAAVLQQDYVTDDQLPVLNELIARGEAGGVAMPQLEILRDNVEVRGRGCVAAWAVHREGGWPSFRSIFLCRA
jgi:hypothetical protein